VIYCVSSELKIKLCSLPGYVAVPVDCNGVIDLAFVLHSAGTVHPERWHYITQFVVDIVKRLDVGLNRTRVAVITYSSTAHVAFTLDQFPARQDAAQVISTRRFFNVLWLLNFFQYLSLRFNIFIRWQSSLLESRGVRNTGIPTWDSHESHGNPEGVGIARLVSREWEWKRLGGNGKAWWEWKGLKTSYFPICHPQVADHQTPPPLQ